MASTADPQVRECNVCGENELRQWRTARTCEPLLSRQTSYALDRCTACGSASIALVDRIREDPALYSGGAYRSPRPAVDALVEPLRRLGDRDRWRFVRRIPSGARVFEIGVGDGRLLGSLARGGYRVAGNEPSTAFAAASRARGFDVSELPVEKLRLEEASYQAVVLWHVLEHLEDPVAALDRIRDWLRPGGSVVIAVPNLESTQAALGGDAWFHQDVPRHRTLFTARGLARLLRRRGFSVAEETTLVLDQSVVGMLQTLLNRLTCEPNVLFRMIKHHRASRRDVVITALATPLLAPVAVGLELCAGAIGRGGIVVARATRP